MSEVKDLKFLNDRRKWLYNKLVKIMDRVENDDLPMIIKEVYLFGGFLRNKAEPSDIDILLIYDSDKTLRKYETGGKKGNSHWRFWEVRKAPSRLRALLKKNAERSVDINICPSLEEFQKDLAYEMDAYLCIWSLSDRNWKSKLIYYFRKLQLAGKPLLE